MHRFNFVWVENGQVISLPVVHKTIGHALKTLDTAHVQPDPSCVEHVALYQESRIVAVLTYVEGNTCMWVPTEFWLG